MGASVSTNASVTDMINTVANEINNETNARCEQNLNVDNELTISDIEGCGDINISNVRLGTTVTTDFKCLNDVTNNNDFNNKLFNEAKSRMETSAKNFGLAINTDASRTY